MTRFVQWVAAPDSPVALEALAVSAALVARAVFKAADSKTFSLTFLAEQAALVALAGRCAVKT
jgi:hypothetical protein